MSNLEKALSYADEQQHAFLDDLKELLCIPSVSTLSEHTPDMQRAAEWIAQQLKNLGFQKVRVAPTGGHPVVTGEYLAAGPDAPTLLFYGHYDVQPVDPIDLWTTPPFEPTQRDGNVYARGASDMKGQLVAHLKAMEAWIKGAGAPLPVNFKMLVEGEEEIGSPHLAPFITEHKDELTCDLCLNADGGILGADAPGLIYALRGVRCFELRVHGPRQDLHSGIFGGAVHNPAQALAKLLAGMHDADGRVTLPGFYDHVRPLDDEERTDLAKLPQVDAWWLQQTGAPALFGEAGYSPVERATARPTLEINGLLSGFTGEGAKTVLPKGAMAKLSMRLVADQDPDHVAGCLRRYLEENAPPSVRWELIEMAGCRPSMVERDSKAVRAAKAAMESVWHTEARLFRMGGSVPVVGEIQHLLGVDSLMLGFGLPDDNLHAPDEKMHIPTFNRGVETCIRFMENLPKQ